MKKSVKVMAAAMAATMLPTMAIADEKPPVTLLVPEYNAGKSLKNEGSDQVIQMDQVPIIIPHVYSFQVTRFVSILTLQL